jgi:hypothetical protein
MGFFGLWCISRAGSASVCFAVVCFFFPWLLRTMSVLFGSVYIFDNTPLGLLSDVFPSCYFDPGWLCAVVFLCVFFMGEWLCASSSLFTVSALCFRWLFTSCFNRISRCGSAAGLCVLVDELLSRCNFHFRRVLTELSIIKCLRINTTWWPHSNIGLYFTFHVSRLLSSSGSSYTQIGELFTFWISKLLGILYIALI